MVEKSRQNRNGDQSELSLNSKSTRRDLRVELRNLLRDPKEFVFHFNGHGVTNGVVRHLIKAERTDLLLSYLAMLRHTRNARQQGLTTIYYYRHSNTSNMTMMIFPPLFLSAWFWQLIPTPLWGLLALWLVKAMLRLLPIELYGTTSTEYPGIKSWLHSAPAPGQLKTLLLTVE